MIYRIKLQTQKTWRKQLVRPVVIMMRKQFNLQLVAVIYQQQLVVIKTTMTLIQTPQ